MENNLQNAIDGLVSKILDDYRDDGRVIDQLNVFAQIDTEVIRDIIEKLFKIIYPGFYREKNYRFYNLKNQTTVILEDVMFNLTRQIALALPQNPENADKSSDVLDEEAQQICLKFFEQIPKIREYIETDVEAFFDGDPAAYNYNEIIQCYPGLYTITINRIAHELFLLKVPLIPRIMTEQAHSKTGIDIHPGATIGKYFFIDHGTGIVVGETTVIGEHVKIYQGVTIGALSTSGGQSWKGRKRHPTIEDDVIIYSGASILGGETVIGKGSVIGGNAFITSSVDPGSRVSIKNQELIIRQGKKKKDVVASDMQPDNSWVYTI